MRSISNAMLAAIALCAGAACDLVVSPGQTTILDNDGQVLGSSGDGFVVARPAVRVDQGSLTVARANVLGGSVIVSRPPPGAFVPAAPAVDSTGGTVRLTSGASVRGGVALVQGPLDNFFLTDFTLVLAPPGTPGC
jgi:hypothetical protein